MKRNKGITLIALIITIIIMLILVAVTLTYGTQTYENVKINRFIAQMQMIQKNIDKFCEELKLIPQEERDNKINGLVHRGLGPDNRSKLAMIIGEEEWLVGGTWDGLRGDINDFIIFNTNDMFANFGLDNLNDGDTFAINFQTREVVSLIGEKYKGKTYYTQYNPILPNGQSLIRYDYEERGLGFEISRVRNYGLNSIIEITNVSVSNATLRYQEGYGPWNIVTNHTMEGEKYEINITKSGDYRIELVDIESQDMSVSYDDFVSIRLHNSPKLTEELTPIYANKEEVDDINDGLWYNYANEYLGSQIDWAFAKTESNETYVWIPRCVWNSENVIKFVKGNTNVPTDNSNIIITTNGTNETYMLLGTFAIKSNITGVWVEVTGSNLMLNLGVEEIKNILDEGRKEIITDNS